VEVVTEALPVGTVTLVLGDLEGSVRSWERDAPAMVKAVGRLDSMISEVAAKHGGVRPVEQGEGDSFVLAFARASAAVACAVDFQWAVANEVWPGDLEPRFRVALHTGEVELRDEGNYAGPTVNRCARLRNLGHGGQVLVSQTTRDLVFDSLTDGVGLRDLGSHVLRDMARPEHVHQLTHPDLPDEFPPLVTGEVPATKLPTQVTSFVGRRRELSELDDLLAETRVLTLTGAGGSGKTRLALAVATEASRAHPHAVRWVDLAPLGDPGLVAGAVAEAAGVQEQRGEDLASTLARALSDRPVMLVFDSCEHLVEACAGLADHLVRACPRLEIVATSREPLGIQGETIYPVPSLGVPEESAPLEGIKAVESVQLFVERARKVRPNFGLTGTNAEAVAQICRHLDGIPLAIELAAARVRVLSPAQIAEALSHSFALLTGGPRTALPRQRTLEASVEWSYELLDEEERAALARLSVFAGTFSLDGAEAVCSGEHLDAYGVFDVVSRLVDRSLVQIDESTGQTRYLILETVRLYGRGRLAGRGETASVRARHLDYCLGLAQQARSGLSGDQLEEWLTLMGAELDNLRTAMDWAMSSERPAAVIELVVPLFTFWVMRGLLAEMQHRLLAAVDAPLVGRADRARALRTASILAVGAGDYATGYELAGEAVDLAREHAGPRSLVGALRNRFWAGFFSGRSTDTEISADFEEALELAGRVDDPETLASVLMYMAPSRGGGGASPAGGPGSTRLSS
jgi:predicted ATPase/class 3 adenylate cyclase